MGWDRTGQDLLTTQPLRTHPQEWSEDDASIQPQTYTLLVWYLSSWVPTLSLYSIWRDREAQKESGVFTKIPRLPTSPLLWSSHPPVRWAQLFLPFLPSQPHSPTPCSSLAVPTKWAVLHFFSLKAFLVCLWIVGSFVLMLGETHWLKPPTLARHHSNHLHELFYDRKSW